MKKVSKLQTGYIYHYAFIMLIGIVTLLTSISMWSTVQSTLFFDSRLIFIYAAVLTFYVSSLSEA
jgi:hypothetical protein